jgi:hypothetical protein
MKVRDCPDTRVFELYKETDEVGDEWYFGPFCFGLLLGYSERSFGWGLFLSLDLGRPDWGIHLVIGPLAFAMRRRDYWELRLLSRHLIGS